MNSKIVEIKKVNQNIEVHFSGGDGVYACYIFVDNKKIASMPYQKNKFFKFKLSISGLYRAVIFCKNENGIERLASGLIKVFIDVDKLISDLTYQKNAESIDKYNYVVNILEENFKNSGDLYSLQKLCRIEKQMYSKFTDKMKWAAKEALAIKPSYQTVYWYLETHCTNISIEKAFSIVEKTFEKISNQELRNYKNLYLASLNNKLGNFDAFEFYLKKYRSGKMFPYNREESLLWLEEPDVKDFSPKTWAGGEVNYDFSPEKYEILNVKYVISVSCDVVYFNRYYKYFIKSWEKNCSNSSVLHIVIVNPDAATIKLVEELSPRVLTSYFYTNFRENIGPISATARLLYLKYLLETFKVPVIVTDFDVVIKNDLSDVVDEFVGKEISQLARIIGVVHPWQRYTAGFNIFAFRDETLLLAHLMQKMIVEDFQHDVKKNYVDQAILESAIRFVKKRMTYRIEPASGDLLNKHLAIPTGSYQSKIDFLESACK